MGWKPIFVAMAAIVGVAASAGAQSTNATPTCSDMLEIDVHGEHIVGDYVTGIGHETLEWEPRGGIVGDTVSDNGGVAIAGGAGRGHLSADVAPGASFCTDSQSPGWPHL